jgi:5-methylcytosine-specific restriction endonuclease McrA
MSRIEYAKRPGRESLRKRIGSRRHEAIMARGGRRCVYCGAAHGPMQIDHVLPRAAGGSDDPANLVVACASCNCQRHDLPMRLWARYLRLAHGWSVRETTAMLRRVRAQIRRPLPV